jgi:hypothetical protein
MPSRLPLRDAAAFAAVGWPARSESEREGGASAAAGLALRAGFFAPAFIAPTWAGQCWRFLIY